MAPEARRRPLRERGRGQPAQHQLAVRVAREGRGQALGRGRRCPRPGRSPRPRDSSIRPAVAVGVLDPCAGRRPPTPRSSGRTAGSTRPRPSCRTRNPPAARSVEDALGELMHPARAARRRRPGRPTPGRCPRPSSGTARSGRSCRSPARCTAPAAGRGPPCASSIRRRVALSWMLAIARLIAAAGSSASWSAITVSGSSEVARATAAASGLRAISARRRNGARRSLAIRSTSSSTPIRRRPAIEHGQVAHAVVEHLEQRLGARAVGRPPSRRARSSPPTAACPGRRRPPPRACGCRGR